MYSLLNQNNSIFLSIVYIEKAPNLYLFIFKLEVNLFISASRII